MRLKSFHIGGSTKLHYHHTLYSILQRAFETITSMKLLFENSLHLNAAVLVRSLYELTLTFYVDWLAPTIMYRFLQLASVMTEKEWEKLCESEMKKRVRDGLPQADARKLYESHMLCFRLGSRTSEKARVFPFGEDFHKDVYSLLSKVSHHDFSMTARYTHTLEHGDESVFNEDCIKTALHCADILTAAILTRVIDDIGHAGERHIDNKAEKSSSA